MKLFLSVIFATLYAVSIRILAGFTEDAFAVMSLAALGLAPIVIGFLTVFFLPPDKATSSGSAFFLPWISTFVILVVTMVFALEGSICWIMIYPFFSAFAGVGGLIAWYARGKRNEKDEPPKPTTLSVSLVLFIPVIAGYLEGNRTLSREEYTITEQIIIPASANEVWKQLSDMNELSPAKQRSSFSHALGFPRHVSTKINKFAVGGKRIAVYERGLFFEETITKIVPGKQLSLAVHCDPKDVPPGVMDEHIVIGGKHLDIVEDTYSLRELPDGSTELSLSSKFWINTPFNWYSGLWADWLMKDILSGQLDLLKEKVERRTTVSSPD